jgi:prepilin-type N-terminal cleavage/methylation domain-containing protein
MKQRSKKGFSLIELIVVIAVIAAIAAVIVPQFSNISSAAKNSADQRNCQLWNETYMNAVAAWPGGSPAAPTTALIHVGGNTGGGADAINVTYNLSGQNVSFSCPEFNIVGTGSITANTEKGIVYSSSAAKP